MDLELDDETMVGSRELQARYKHQARITIHRWKNDKELGFPQPVKINRRLYWRLGDIRQWERDRAAKVQS
jgi:hypothetical protein